MSYEEYLATKDQTEIYYAVMTRDHKYRYICDGWPIKSPTNASLYDAPEDVAKYGGRVYEGDVIEPIVFSRSCYSRRRAGC